MTGPNLINRFNVDYNFKDFISSIYYVTFNKKVDSDFYKDFFDNQHIFFTNSGRSALYLILKSLELPSGSKIGIQLYCCREVFEAIKQAGYEPCFLDIDLNTYTLSINDLKKKVFELDALIVVHTFGYPAEMDKIKKIAKNVPIIEDCAHSLLSEYNGVKCGKFGSYAFFSFRLRKFVSAGQGGLVLVNNKKKLNSFHKYYAQLKRPNLLSEYVHIFKTYLRSILSKKPFYGLISFNIWRLTGKNKDFLGEKGFKKSLIMTSDKLVAKIKINKALKKRSDLRENYFQYMNSLKNKEVRLLPNKKSVKLNYAYFPIGFKNKNQREKAISILLNNNVDSSKIWHGAVNNARRFGYKNDCPNSKIASDTVLLIPNYYDLAKNDVRNISELLKEI